MKRKGILFSFPYSLMISYLDKGLYLEEDAEWYTIAEIEELEKIGHSFIEFVAEEDQQLTLFKI